MGDFAARRGAVYEAFGGAKGTHGAADTKGSWSQIIASTVRACESFVLTAKQDSGDGGVESFLFDIGIGGAGSEKVILPNIPLDQPRYGWIMGVMIHAPIAIPAATRVAVRCQSDNGAGTRGIRACVTGFSGGPQAPMALGSAAEAYGATTASTNGTLVDQGGTANTYGSWAQLTSSSARKHDWFCVCFGQNKHSGAPVVADYTVQIGIGAGGSEVVIAEFETSYSTINTVCPTQFPFFAQVPEGTRIAARCKATDASAANRNLSMVLLGV